MGRVAEKASNLASALASIGVERQGEQPDTWKDG